MRVAVSVMFVSCVTQPAAKDLAPLYRWAHHSLYAGCLSSTGEPKGNFGHTNHSVIDNLGAARKTQRYEVAAW